MANRHFGNIADVWKHLDQESITDLRRWSRRLGLHRCEVTEGDGMAAVAAWLTDEARRPGLVHIDPFDPYIQGPDGCSALELAARVADSGAGLVYWYGNDEPDAPNWVHRQLTDLTSAPFWYGEVAVAGRGDLDQGVGPPTSGIILANVQAGTTEACAALGSALADAYAAATLPDGSAGSLAFSSGNSAGRALHTSPVN